MIKAKTALTRTLILMDLVGMAFVVGLEYGRTEVMESYFNKEEEGKNAKR
jgi:hypothetical protein